jgi:TPR repeat protein
MVAATTGAAATPSQFRGLRGWACFCLLGFWGLFSLPLAAAAPVERLVTELAAGRVPSPTLLEALEDSGQGLFVLGWLYEQGRYGVAPDPDRARAFFARAARAGHWPVLGYCWRRCLDEDAEFRALLVAAVEGGHPEALYLQSLLLARDAAPEAADARLREAAGARHPDAIGRLYVDHFVAWAGAGHSFAAAEAKLRRCTAEGVTVCYYLLGALYERHRDTRQALWAYQVLALADPALFDAYLSPRHLEGLLARLPTGSESLVRARAASELIHHPSTGFDRIDRFRVCADQSDHGCARQLSLRDGVCVPPAGAVAAFAGFRGSPGYRACLAKGTATE